MSEGLLIGILSGGGAAAIALLSQQLKWLNDRNNKRNQRREKILAELRNYIATQKWNSEEVCKMTAYSQVRPYLSEKTTHRIEHLTSRIVTSIGPLRDDIEHRLLDELSDLERHWNLV